VPEATVCRNPHCSATEQYFEDLRDLVIVLLDGPAFGTPAVRTRQLLAALGEEQGWYWTRGDGGPTPPAKDEPPADDVTEEELSELRDFRDAGVRAADAKLHGVWYRCVEHGLTQEPIVIASTVNCPTDPCNRRVLLVSTVKDRTK
jgi:hypothetical protein